MQPVKKPMVQRPIEESLKRAYDQVPTNIPLTPRLAAALAQLAAVQPSQADREG